VDATGRALSQDELLRYHRQIIYQDWGEEGQRKVKTATVFLAGVGGLGGPVSLYLAAAGVGRLRICDNGYVEFSNLNRQILYTDRDIDERKVLSAKNVLHQINPHIEIEYFSDNISGKNIETLAGDADVLVDCLDNFETRYILNEYAVYNKVPFVHAGVEGFAGQLTFIHPPETPCLQCVIPEAPLPQETFPIIGATAGIIGCLEANEVLKYITGIGSTLKGLLMIWNGIESEFYRIETDKDPNCRVCGSK